MDFLYIIFIKILHSKKCHLITFTYKIKYHYDLYLFYYNKVFNEYLKFKFYILSF
jgi:hypothetical protein